MSETASSARRGLLQAPRVEDAAAIYKLVTQCKPLDVNSEYLYLLLCSHFNDTCVVAHLNKEVVGATTAYLVPERPDTLFVWQIAVAQKVRKLGLAMTMLKHLLRRRSCRSIQYIETTISPSNQASLNLFDSLARELKAPLQQSECFSSQMFLGSDHEAENLIRIGPIKSEVLQ